MTNFRDLTIEVERPAPHFAEVRLLLDGVDELDPTGHEQGPEPDQLLRGGALLPTEPAQRVALYGCDCGDFGCTTITALIAREGDAVTWSDFRNVKNVFYWGPLPHPETTYVQTAFDEAEPLAIPTIVFHADQYLSEVARATADRAWETRGMETVRLFLARGTGHSMSVRDDGEGIFFIEWRNGRFVHTYLTVPAGPVEEGVDRLVNLLSSHTPSEIAEKSLWL